MTEKTRNNLVITVSAPSGTGKGAVADALVAREHRISYFPTATTRAPRQGEVDGVNYHFLSRKAFEKKLKEGAFVEWVEYNGNLYGTLRDVIEEKMAAGLDVISDVTWDGVAAFRKAWPDRAVSLLLMPPSFEALDARLTNRQKTSAEDDVTKTRRLTQVGEDVRRWREPGYRFTCPDLLGSGPEDYDCILENNDLEETVRRALKFIEGRREYPQ